jgi:hypothetical protein
MWRMTTQPIPTLPVVFASGTLSFHGTLVAEATLVIPRMWTAEQATKVIAAMVDKYSGSFRIRREDTQQPEVSWAYVVLTAWSPSPINE